MCLNPYSNGKLRYAFEMLTIEKIENYIYTKKSNFNFNFLN